MGILGYCFCCFVMEGVGGVFWMTYTFKIASFGRRPFSIIYIHLMQRGIKGGSNLCDGVQTIVEELIQTGKRATSSLISRGLPRLPHYLGGPSICSTLFFAVIVPQEG